MPTTPYGLGCPPSPPDDRDFAPQAVTPDVLAALPDQYIVSPWAPIQNQGPEGTCAGHAAKGWADHHELRLCLNRMRSARDIYEGARIIAPVNGEGAHLRAICKWLAKEGACEERLWPYIADLKGAPAPGAAESRKTCRALDYWRVSTEVAELRAQLKERGPLLARIETCEGFRTPRGGAPIVRRGAEGGGHAILVIGWNEKARTLRIRNSWGRTWGDGGYADLSYDYGITEAWALTPAVLAVAPVPEPTPVPPPPPAPVPPAPWWEQVFRWIGGL